MNSPSSLTLRLRTRDNLMELLLAGKSGAWKIAKNKEQEISKVEIFNWDGSLKLEAIFDLSKSSRTEDHRLIVGLSPEDAKIIRCDPPFKWVGQNSVNYFNENHQEEEKELGSEEVSERTEVKLEDQLQQICEQVIKESIRLIEWDFDEETNQFQVFFRDLAGNCYFEMLILENDQGNWSSEYRIYPVFQSLLDQEGTWMTLTAEATEEDWKALDQLFSVIRYFPHNEIEVMLADTNVIGEDAIDEALERFGFYIPDEDLLPVFLFENKRLNLVFVSYFKNPEKFANENMVQDNNTHHSEIFNSLAEGIDRLIQKIDYYLEELLKTSKSEEQSVNEEKAMSSMSNEERLIYYANEGDIKSWNQWKEEYEGKKMDEDEDEYQKMVDERCVMGFPSGTDLSGLNLIGADLRCVGLSGVNLSNADLFRADLEAVNLDNANLEGANLSKANLEGAWMNDVKARGANFSNANLRYAALHGDLVDINLSNAKFGGEHCWLQGNLTNANLEDANLKNAIMCNSILKGANMRNVNLENADLSGADLENADLSGANLTDAKLTGTILEDNSLQEEDEDFNNIKIEDLVDLDDEINELTQGIYLKKESYTRKEFLIVLDYCLTYYDIGLEGEAWGGKIQRGWQKKLNQDAPIRVKLTRGEEINFYPDFVQLDSRNTNPGFKYISHFPMNLERAKYLMYVLELLERDGGFTFGISETPTEPDEDYDGFFDFGGP